MLAEKGGEAVNKLNKEEIRRTLRENLREFRVQSGRSQEEVAKVLGVTRPTYTYYETGKTTPSVEDLYLLSQLYGRAMEEFFQ